MKKTLLVVLAFIGVSASAAVKFALDIEYAGSKTSPSIVVKSGEAATLTQNDLKVEIKADDRSHDRVEVFFKVFQQTETGEILLATPAVSTAWGTTAEITQKTFGRGDTLRLRVKPTLVP